MHLTFHTEADLIALRGQPESARLEFKASALLEKPKDELAEDLSKEISAFANSEGGEIVIGIREKKEGKTRVADDVDDGIEAGTISTEWLQQIAQSNVSPYLPGLRVIRIPLSGPKHGRTAFVIFVPQGSTAYQASDRRYYGRSEYQVQALPDHEVRLRMMRGRLARVRFEAVDSVIVTADEELAKRKKQIEEIAAARGRGELRIYGKGIPAREALEAPRRDFDALSISTEVINVGEISIRDFLLVLECDPPLAFQYRQGHGDAFVGVVGKEGSEIRFRFRNPEWRDEVTKKVRPESKLFPGQRLAFPGRITLHVPNAEMFKHSKVPIRWAVYLDDAPPSSGELELDRFLNPAHCVAR